MSGVRKSAWVVVHCRATRRFLIARRSPQANNPRLWNFFGGRVDGDETPRDAALREMREEAGLTLPLLFLGALPMPGGTGFYFAAEVPKEITPRLNGEHDRAQWVDVDVDPRKKRFHKPTRIFLRNALRERVTTPAVRRIDDYFRKVRP